MSQILVLGGFFLFLFYLSAFLVVGEVTVSREASCTELFPGVWVLVGLVETATLSDIYQKSRNNAAHINL